MKKLLMPCIVAAMMFGFTVPSSATLVLDGVYGDTVVYDDIADRYWYRSLVDLTEMTYTEQIEFIAGLNTEQHAGLSNWHMATGEDFDVLWGNGAATIADAFHPSAEIPLYTEWTMWYVGRCDEAMSEGYHAVAYVIDDDIGGITTDGTPGALLSSSTLDGDTSFLFAGIDAPLGAWITASVEPEVDNAMAFKADAIEVLKAVGETGDRKVDHDLNAAIKHINRSLGVGNKHVLWLDEMHIDSKHGKKVFDEEKKAVAKLKHLLREGKGRHPQKHVPQEIREAAQAAIDMLIDADTLLAMQAWADAQAAHDVSTGDRVRKKISRELAKCSRELDKAINEGQKGHPGHVIDHLKKAWEHAQHALKVQAVDG